LNNSSQNGFCLKEIKTVRFETHTANSVSVMERFIAELLLGVRISDNDTPFLNVLDVRIFTDSGKAQQLVVLCAGNNSAVHCATVVFQHGVESCG